MFRKRPRPAEIGSLDRLPPRSLPRPATNANLGPAETEAGANRVRQASHDVPVADEQAGGSTSTSTEFGPGSGPRSPGVPGHQGYHRGVLHHRLHGSPRGRSRAR